MYRALDPGAVRTTLKKLELRILDRFPGSGLAAVCGELIAVADESQPKLATLREPNRRLRLMVAAVIVAGTAGIAALATVLLTPEYEADLFEALQGIDSALSIVVLAGASLFFLLQWETRRKSAIALDALAEIRSLIHVIDMHQLTKDPSSRLAPPTVSSPERELDPASMVRYLDYCSELLSLSAKVAALYAQSFPESIVLETVNDIEHLTSGLSQKIWQKITILHRELEDMAVSPPSALPTAPGGL